MSTSSSSPEASSAARRGRLHRLMHIVEKTILTHIDPITSLFSTAQPTYPNHAWIRDNVYAVHALWAMYLAYRKCSGDNEDAGQRAHELSMTCIKCMRGLLDCFMSQCDKIERFKISESATDSLHAKYNARLKRPIVGDEQWGHLQIDAISLYLLTLAQMTASGLQIVRNFDEVAVIQNLTYYIEHAYRIPDFGQWERGDKTNQGVRELNSSSIGMAKAALQAMNDVGDLFADGSRGSIIHVMPDEIQQCSAVLCSMLPLESFSKTDAGLLSVIAYPAFAVEDAQLVNSTRDTIKTTLNGQYGCRRFIRDGYKTAVEDPNRLYYDNVELAHFEDIECEWPLFTCYLLLDALFANNVDDIAVYYAQMEKLTRTMGGVPQMPELYTVPRDLIETERKHRGTVQRVPAGRMPYVWAQSLYILCQLLMHDCLRPAELDPLSRRLQVTDTRPPTEVQVVILAENAAVQKTLLNRDIKGVQTVADLDPVFVLQPASVLAQILHRVGQNEKLHLTGRPLDRDVGLLSTSRLYQLGDKFIVFTPQFMERQRSYTFWDIRVLMDEWRSELQYIHTVWHRSAISGRPLVVLVIGEHMVKDSPSTLRRSSTSNVTINTLKKLKSGYLGGARIVCRRLHDFFRTTTVSKLELHDENTADSLVNLADITDDCAKVHILTGRRDREDEIAPSTAPLDVERQTARGSTADMNRKIKRMDTIRKTTVRHRSVMLDSNDDDLARLRLKYYNAHDPFEEEPTSPVSPTPIIVDAPSESNLESIAEQSSGSGSGVLRSPEDGEQALTVMQHASKFDLKSLGDIPEDELMDMLADSDVLEDQGVLLHYLWLNKGPEWDTGLGETMRPTRQITVRELTVEVFDKACATQSWGLVRCASGLLQRNHTDLPKAVTHLLVRQKQITIGLPTQREVAIQVPKSTAELRRIFDDIYKNQPTTCMLAQEIAVHLGSLVRTDPQLFVEMFRLRIGLIIQVLASELARSRQCNVEEASEALIEISPYDLKRMLSALLGGRLLNEVQTSDEESTSMRRDQRTGLLTMRKKIEQRKSRRSMHATSIVTDGLELPQFVGQADKKSRSFIANVGAEDSSDEDTDADEDKAFVFGVWLRHRCIDGALNRVPQKFYSGVWDALRLFPMGMSISDNVLPRRLTEEMTRHEIKFALQIEKILNAIPEPEYRELIVEILTLMAHMRPLLRSDPVVPYTDRPFVVDDVLREANALFLEHNKALDTIVVECCADVNVGGGKCDGAQGICRHFYDSAPAGEFGTAHYCIKAMMNIFLPRDE